MDDHTSLIWNVSTQSRVFLHYKVATCVEIFISLSCLFVHEPLYQTRVASVLQFRFCYSSLCMDHLAILHVRVGLTQAHS